ncbi:hypothetical protein [Kitasatospora paranensis]|uniref:Uncharacterized protein n=1 Tax=Kitasatospora paranensis TaxID=258053 RepID=A0ABW2FVK9_9ACTN
MADNETTTTDPTASEAAAPAVHTTPAADAQPIETILDSLVEEPGAEPAPVGDQKKNDGTFEPLGTVINRP